MSSGSIIEQADRAAASGNFAQAQNLLRQAANDTPGDFQLLLKLAAVSRAAGQPAAALAAVHEALALSPLDFVALTLRASVIETLGLDSGEAWSNALAQKPAGELPPALAAAVAKGEQRCAEWVAAREQRMAEAMAAAEQQADDEQRQRMIRFRTNVLRRTRPFHSSPTHFHYPSLTEQEFHPRRLFPWLELLEAATELISTELEAVMTAERAELVPYIQYPEHEPLDQWRSLNKNADWTAIHLWRNGARVEANAQHCPATLSLLESVPQPQIPGAGPNAMFSLLAPHTAIPPHVGVNNARLVCHLPLIVPAGCWFRVGAETREWRRGEAFVFDDTIEHEAMNPSDQLRIVFIFDIWHPDLEGAEREAVAALIEAEGSQEPGL